MEKISWTDRVKHKEILQGTKKERNILNTVNEGRLNGLVTKSVGTVV